MEPIGQNTALTWVRAEWLLLTSPMPIILAYVFTDRPFAGNPAAAVLDADRLDNVSMPRIATELRVAATAFVSTPIPGDADWRLRMFTPMQEVGYSGHTALYGTHTLSSRPAG